MPPAQHLVPTNLAGQRTSAWIPTLRGRYPGPSRPPNRGNPTNPADSRGRADAGSPTVPVYPATSVNPASPLGPIGRAGPAGPAGPGIGASRSLPTGFPVGSGPSN